MARKSLQKISTIQRKTQKNINRETASNFLNVDSHSNVCRYMITHFYDYFAKIIEN